MAGRGGSPRSMAHWGWILFVVIALLGAWRVVPHDPAQWWSWAQDRAASLQGGYEAAVDGGDVGDVTQAWAGLLPSGGGSGSGSSGSGSDGSGSDGSGSDGSGSDGSGEQGSGSSGSELSVAERAQKRLAGLTVAAELSMDSYDRDQWRHWDNVTSCWTVREEVLARDSAEGELTVLDGDGVVTGDPGAFCKVTGGVWWDPYTAETFTNPEDLDIDHVVPLAEAHRSGGAGWSEDQKADYANDLRTGHLVPVAAGANRSKGDKDPADWMPPNDGVSCGYVATWIAVKHRWGLSVDEAEVKVLRDVLAGC